MTDRRVLVTGATGFVGTWVLHHWRDAYPEAELWATSAQPASCVNVEPDQYRQVDLLDKDSVLKLVGSCRPTHVVHLAGLIGDNDLADLLDVNVVGTERLYRALAEIPLDQKPRVVQASSAAKYGLVRPEELPVREDQLARPVSPYALSKLCQDYLADAIWRTDELPVVSAVIFNILGPGQPDILVPMTFIRQMKEHCAAGSNRLKVGNIATRRDFVDVRDVAAAFDALLEHGVPGQAYNIGSGTDVSIADLIQQIMEISGRKIPLEVASSRFRSTDVERICADVTKIADHTGWKPGISLTSSLKAMWVGESDRQLHTADQST